MFAILTLVALVLLVIAERSRHRGARALTKVLASSGFMATALAAGALESAWGQTLLVALGLSMVGDIFLISRATAMFAGGLGAFLLAHVVFGVAFVVLGVDLGATAIVGALLVVFIVKVAAWVLPHVPGRLRAPVIAYILAVSAMAALAIGASWSSGEPAIAIAGVAFLISDVFVARDRFVTPGFANRLYGLPLYYGAQVLFALHAGAPGGALVLT
ncbi:MAG: lysoplasmalogenase [Myxococcales bacterium]|nr:lysoplasmalogenase [Myxococcales bacterium]MCB9568247.1 lysoplasmalogenase [Myxococcales bacterium]MCB9704970.1 lysoplasmalogenase [Myxococcales bacterium]